MINIGPDGRTRQQPAMAITAQCHQRQNSRFSWPWWRRPRSTSSGRLVDVVIDCPRGMLVEDAWASGMLADTGPDRLGEPRVEAKRSSGVPPARPQLIVS
jgi:hypothetical protein